MNLPERVPTMEAAYDAQRKERKDLLIRTPGGQVYLLRTTPSGVSAIPQDCTPEVLPTSPRRATRLRRRARGKPSPRP